MKPKTSKTIVFQTDLSPDNAFAILSSYFDKTTRSINKYPKASGYFLTDREFEMRSRWEMTFYRNGYKRDPLLKGQIVPIANNQSKILITQNRSYGFSWYQLLVYLLPFFIIIKAIVNKEGELQIRTGIFFIVFITVALVFALSMSQNSTLAHLKRELQMRQIQID